MSALARQVIARASEHPSVVWGDCMPRTPADEESANTVAPAVLVIVDPTDAAAMAANRDLVATMETIAPLVRFTRRAGAKQTRLAYRADLRARESGGPDGEFYFYRYFLSESSSQFDLLPLISSAFESSALRVAFADEEAAPDAATAVPPAAAEDGGDYATIAVTLQQRKNVSAANASKQMLASASDFEAGTGAAKAMAKEEEQKEEEEEERKDGDADCVARASHIIVLLTNGVLTNERSARLLTAAATSKHASEIVYIYCSSWDFNSFYDSDESLVKVRSAALSLSCLLLSSRHASSSHPTLHLSLLLSLSPA